MMLSVCHYTHYLDQVSVGGIRNNKKQDNLQQLSLRLLRTSHALTHEIYQNYEQIYVLIQLCIVTDNIWSSLFFCRSKYMNLTAPFSHLSTWQNNLFTKLHINSFYCHKCTTLLNCQSSPLHAILNIKCTFKN